MRHCFPFLTLLTLLALAACSTTALPPVQYETPLFADRLFKPASETISADQVFAVDAQMKHFVETELADKIREKGPQLGLYEALYARNALQIDYDASETRTAAQTFAAHSGNCLSMAIMTAALANEIGLKVAFRRVYVEESWSHVGQTYFSAGHVNVTLLNPPSKMGIPVLRTLTVDFIPEVDLVRYDSETLDESTIVAMYMNNRAAEALASGKLDDAYWWARAAITQDKGFTKSYNTLGAIYEAHGNFPEAELALNLVLRLRPNDVIAMSNLANVLKGEGRNNEYLALAHKLEQMQPYPPFYFFNRGRAAMQAGDYETARSMFKKEIERDPDYHEFQCWYALANYHLGRLDVAEQYMTLAMENSTTRQDRSIYAAKLDHLKSLEKSAVPRPSMQ